jgi:hypothetical protein
VSLNKPLISISTTEEVSLAVRTLVFGIRVLDPSLGCNLFQDTWDRFLKSDTRALPAFTRSPFSFFVSLFISFFICSFLQD